MEPALVIPIVALLIPIIVVPTALGLRHARYLRQVEHAERMRALELGRSLSEERPWTPSGVAASIGAGVPIAAMVVAWLASPEANAAPPSVIQSIWQTAGMVGLGGVICGTVLASQMIARREKPAAPAVEEKPAYDPDEFDVVGRRG